MSWVMSPWGALVCYAVAALVVVPLVWWAALTPRRQAEREAEAAAIRRQRIKLAARRDALYIVEAFSTGKLPKS